MTMADVDWVLKNGRVVTEQGIIEGGLAVSGERIVAIGMNQGLPSATREVDAGGCWVIPGGVDTHVHIHYDAPVFRGDFGTETRAALLGGTTTVTEFAHGGEPGLLKSFAKKKGAAEELAVSDYSFHAVLRAEHDLEDIPAILDKGVLSVKAMLADPNGIRPIMSGLLMELFRMVGERDGLIVVHAENEEIHDYRRRLYKAQNKSGPIYHALSRPVLSEGEAIARSILFAREYGVRLHIFHLSSAMGIELIAEAQERGLPVTAETCPHFLLFTQDDIAGEFGPFLQVNPPIKMAEDRAAMWQALQDGVVEAVVSDHYAPLKEEKAKGWENIWEVEGGVPGIEARMPVLWQRGVMEGKLSPEQFVDLTATNPAKICGLYPRKGALRVGGDADIAIWDEEKTWTIGVDTLHETADWTPYAGIEVHGYPTKVFLRGRLVAQDGELLASKGSGAFIPRQS
ncbi:MAG: hypothetical protein A2Z37_05295 [Chloroflexi bacterium RBG_19FT_COMBO_62_14]|nr:MAG: hypothetical protein A2Z37_05295 [Chloroflexi bacterium RBG_19FT_COMBO_62_14]